MEYHRKDLIAQRKKLEKQEKELKEKKFLFEIKMCSIDEYSKHLLKDEATQLAEQVKYFKEQQDSFEENKKKYWDEVFAKEPLNKLIMLNLLIFWAFVQNQKNPNVQLSLDF